MDGILISYGELFIKSQKVREIFKRRLLNNIKLTLNRENIKYKLNCFHDRMFLETKNINDAKNIVRNIPGVSFIAPCYFITKTDLKEIIDFVSKNYAEWISKNETFAVRVRRDNTIKYKSPEIANQIGKIINRKVDLSKPDREIFVEMRSNGTYIYFEKIKGLGGLPVGSSGKVLSLMSGGIDSPVSSYLMLKRGCELNYIHYHSVPATNNQSIIKSKDLCKLLLKYQPKSRLFSVPFYKIQMEIKMKVEPQYRIVLYRRFMLRIAEEIAKKNDYKALVTGEALGQVSSQTIDNMCVINDSVKMTVLRPLVGYNKEEIISIAKQINSYDISIIPQGDCCTLFTPKHPTTKATLEKVKELEKDLDIKTLIKDAIEKIEIFEFK